MSIRQKMKMTGLAVLTAFAVLSGLAIGPTVASAGTIKTFTPMKQQQMSTEGLHLSLSAEQLDGSSRVGVTVKLHNPTDHAFSWAQQGGELPVVIVASHQDQNIIAQEWLTSSVDAVKAHSDILILYTELLLEQGVYHIFAEVGIDSLQHPRASGAVHVITDDL